MVWVLVNGGLSNLDMCVGLCGVCDAGYNALNGFSVWYLI